MALNFCRFQRGPDEKKLHEECEQARLWAPLAFRPKNYVEMDHDWDVLLREPIIPAFSGVVMVGFEAALLEYHRENLEAGRVIPTQLTKLGPRNAWLISSFKKEDRAGEDAVSRSPVYALSFQVVTSGVFSFKSIDQATQIFVSAQAVVAHMTGIARDLIPAILTTDSILRDPSGKEKAARNFYFLMHKASGFKFIGSPLFMRSKGTVEDYSTAALIQQIFSKEGVLKKYAYGELKRFLDLNAKASKSFWLYSLVVHQAYRKALKETLCETDPAIKRLMHVLLAWKVLDCNAKNKGHEPFRIILDEFRSVMSGERPIYHIWQLALNALIHVLSGQALLNLQCKSGKDRTGMALVCLLILNKIYDPDHGFLMGSKSVFMRALQTVFLLGDAQLIASEGATQGCFGIMDNKEVRDVFARIFGLALTDLLSGVLISEQANGRKNIRTNPKAAAHLCEVEEVLSAVRENSLRSLSTRSPGSAACAFALRQAVEGEGKLGEFSRLEKRELAVTEVDKFLSGSGLKSGLKDVYKGQFRQAMEDLSSRKSAGSDESKGPHSD